MITGKEDLQEALVEIFVMEKGTQVFYKEAAEKAARHEVKKIFGELSAWEEKHMDFIQYLYQALNEDHELKSFEKFKSEVPAPYAEGAIPLDDLEKKLEKHEYTHERGALDFAMKIEGKAYNLYLHLSERADDGNAREIFKEMMAQEGEHIQYLKKLKEGISG